ncbi:4-(cytidine 5'-diphospho)-2-C-methyl-D-erythritol kinase [Myxococcota bacterium]|nr:4-(cytidine 5'-diphospho)-2-C-methyl-D-erythritol kinase [Myxococcota bacterium]
METSQLEVRLEAPAKINFDLHVVGQREDGYHELDSLMLPLDLADDVRIRAVPDPAAAIRIRVLRESAHQAPGGAPPPGDVPEGPENLAVRAGEAFLAEAGLSYRLEIELTKRIPAAAGLGGGSSDAAAVLRGLWQLFPGAVTQEWLDEAALRLGADVPFFLRPRPARIRGIGERIEEWPGMPSLPLVLAHPGEFLVTGDVFRAFDGPASGAGNTLTPRARPPRMRPAGRRPTPSQILAGLGPVLENDLAEPAEQLCAGIRPLRDRLARAEALAVGMSGSGSTVFGVFESLADAQQALLAAFGAEPGASLAGEEHRGLWARVASTVQSDGAGVEPTGDPGAGETETGWHPVQEIED